MTVFSQEVQILLKKLIPLLFVIVQSLPLAALSNEMKNQSKWPIAAEGDFYLSGAGKGVNPLPDFPPPCEQPCRAVIYRCANRVVILYARLGFSNRKFRRI